MTTYDKKHLEVESQVTHTTHKVVGIQESCRVSTPNTRGNPDDHSQNAPGLPSVPPIRPYYRSYVSKKPDPPAWIEEPTEEANALFEEGEVVLLLGPGGSLEGSYTIKTSHGDGKYSLYHIDRIVSQSELKRPDHQTERVG